MSEKIDVLQNQNEALEQRIAKLEALMHVQLAESGGQSRMSNELSVMSGASLSQNIPNPFNHTTTISYSLPQQYSSAKIIVVDELGKTIKTFNLFGTGKGSVTFYSSFSAGVSFQYSLYVDGKLIGTKQMVVAK